MKGRIAYSSAFQNNLKGTPYEPLLEPHPYCGVHRRIHRNRFRATGTIWESCARANRDRAQHVAQTVVYQRQKQPHQAGGEDAGGTLGLQGRAGDWRLRPVDCARRRGANPQFHDGEWQSQGDQSQRQNRQGRIGRRAEGVLRRLRCRLRRADRCEGQRYDPDGAAPTLEIRPAVRLGLPLERRVWLSGRLSAAEGHCPAVERRTLVVGRRRKRSRSLSTNVARKSAALSAKERPGLNSWLSKLIAPNDAA